MLFKVVARECKKGWPIGYRRMPAGMLTKSNLSIDQSSFDGREVHPLPRSFLPNSLYTGPAATAAMNIPRASTQAISLLPALMNMGRGAHNANSSCASTGRSFHRAADRHISKNCRPSNGTHRSRRHSRRSPALRRCSLAPPSPDELINAMANRGS